MMVPRAAADPGLVPLFAVAGLAIGCGYFTALRRGVAAWVTRGAVRQCIGWLLARLAAAVLLFASAGHWGAWPLAGAFLGFLAARQIAIARARSAA